MRTHNLSGYELHNVLRLAKFCPFLSEKVGEGMYCSCLRCAFIVAAAVFLFLCNFNAIYVTRSCTQTPYCSRGQSASFQIFHVPFTVVLCKAVVDVVEFHTSVDFYVCTCVYALVQYCFMASCIHFYPRECLHEVRFLQLRWPMLIFIENFCESTAVVTPFLPELNPSKFIFRIFFLGGSDDIPPHCRIESTVRIQAYDQD